MTHLIKIAKYATYRPLKTIKNIAQNIYYVELSCIAGGICGFSATCDSSIHDDVYNKIFPEKINSKLSNILVWTTMAPISISLLMAGTIAGAIIGPLSPLFAIGYVPYKLYQNKKNKL